MSTLVQRAITGTIFVAILVGSILLSPYTFSALFLLITILGCLEFYRLCGIGPEETQNSPQRIVGTLTAISFFLSCSLVAMNYVDVKFLLINIPFMFLIFVNELYLKRSDPFKNIAYTLLGVIYVAVPISLLNFIVFPHFETDKIYHPTTLLGFFFILWANDTGAYLFGTRFGNKKLFERVSPGKSWEGTIGGGISSLAVAYLISNYYTQVSLIDWIVVALMLVIIGTLGDLVQSLYKRSKNIKDSGNLLPGHGGILDRFDSLLLATPFVFTYLQIVN